MGLFDGTPLERPVTCARCGRPGDGCTCPRDQTGEVRLPRDQSIRVRRERRRGKWTTVAEGFDPVASDVTGLCRSFKTKLGVGGTATGGVLELQGDLRDRLVDELRQLGYSAKPAGG
jgi:translation initiation factor 1